MSRTHGGPLTGAGSTFWLVAAWAALDGAVAVYLHVYGVNAISTALLVLAAAAFAVAVATGGRDGSSVVPAVLALVLLHVVLRVVVPFRPGPPASEPIIPVAAAAATALMLGGMVLMRRAGIARLMDGCLLGVAVLGLVCRAWVVLVDSYPTFDVPRIQEAAAAALLAGSDPYLTEAYHSGYPYLPLAAIGAAMGSLLGDARWAVVAGDALTLIGIVIMAHRLRAPRHLGAATAALWAWWAGGLYVVWQGFPEPLLVGFMTLGVALTVGPRRYGIAGGILLGLSTATKQFGVAMLPFLLPFREGRRVFLVAVLTVVLAVLPFLLWHTREFLDGSFWSLLAEPGRDYSLNLLVWPSGRLDPPYLPILAAGLVAGWLVSVRFASRGEDAGWLAGSATLLMVAFLANRIAFVNYYSMLMVVLLLVVLVLSRSEPARPVGRTPTR